MMASNANLDPDKAVPGDDELGVDDLDQVGGGGNFAGDVSVGPGGVNPLTQ